MAVCINVLGLIFAVMTHTTIALIHELFEWHPQFKRHPSIPRKAFVRKLIYSESCHTSPCLTAPRLTRPRLAPPCQTLPNPHHKGFHTSPYRTRPCHAPSCPALPYRAMPRPHHKVIYEPHLTKPDPAKHYRTRPKLTPPLPQNLSGEPQNG